MPPKTAVPRKQKRLAWELPHDAVPLTVDRDSALLAVHELLRLVLEWEAGASPKARSGLNAMDVEDLRGTFDATEGDARLHVAVNLLLQRRRDRLMNGARARVVGAALAVDRKFKELGGDRMLRATGGSNKAPSSGLVQLRGDLCREMEKQLRDLRVVPETSATTAEAASAIKRIVEHFTSTHTVQKKRRAEAESAGKSAYKGKTKDAQRLLRLYDALQRELAAGAFGNDLASLRLSPSTMRNIAHALHDSPRAGMLGKPARAQAVHRDADGHFDVLRTLVEDAFRLAVTGRSRG